MESKVLSKDGKKIKLKKVFTRNDIKIFIKFKGDQYAGAAMSIDEVDEEFSMLNVDAKDEIVFRVDPDFFMKNNIKLDAGSIMDYLCEGKDRNTIKDFTRLDFDNIIPVSKTQRLKGMKMKKSHCYINIK